MNKFKLFIENFIVYGFGGTISKVIPLIMVPIIIRLLPDKYYYGINDMSNTVISFASAVAILGMYDAMYRLFFDKEEEQYKKEICSTTFFFTGTLSVIVFVLMIVFRKTLSVIFLKDIYLNYVIFISAFAALTSATNGIISAPTRMQNKRVVFLITNSIGPIVAYSIAIPLIIKGFYVTALPLAFAFSSLFTEVIFAVLNRRWFSIKFFRKSYLKPLLAMALPVAPGFFIYWIYNFCDRLMITHLLSLGDDAIYAVGSKFGSASHLIYVAFAGGWQFFAFSVMKDKKQVETNSKIFEYLGIVSFICFSFICIIVYPFFSIVFKGTDYVAGYITAPYLFMAPLLQMLYQVEANQFFVIKKTWPTLLILTPGALINIALNYFLIGKIGIEGAAVASLIGYLSTVIICSIVLTKMKLLILSVKFLVSCVLCTGFFVYWRFVHANSFILALMGFLCIFVIFVCLYRKELKELMIKIKASIKPILQKKKEKIENEK